MPVVVRTGVASAMLKWALAVLAGVVVACGSDGPVTPPPPPGPEPVASVRISGLTDSVRLGKILQLVAEPLDASGRVLNGRTISWSGGNGAASVSASGVLTAIGLGTATISATCEGVSGNAGVRVIAGNVATVEVAPSAAVIQAGGAPVQFVATLKDSVGNLVTGRVITWSASPTTDPTYLSSTGLLTAFQPSTPGQVTATAEGKQGTAGYSITPPDDFGTILTDAVAGNQYDIYTLTAGGVPFNVTNTPGTYVSEYTGAWSPDGARIAFVASIFLSTVPDELVVIDADGGNRQQLISGTLATTYYLPSWSPDGTQLLFSFSWPGGPTGYIRGVATIPASGGSPPTVLAADSTLTDLAYFPVWSPDGSTIAFLSFPGIAALQNGQGNVSIMAANGTGCVELFTDQVATRDVTWSPDGSKIAFISGQAVYSYKLAGDLVVMNADGSGRMNLTTGLTTIDYAWSPDGTEIAYARIGSYNPSNDIQRLTEIMATRVDGSATRALTAPFDLNGRRLFAATNPVWSPDGTSVGFVGVLGTPNQFGLIEGAARVFLVRTQGTSAVALPLPGGDVYGYIRGWKP